MERRAIPRFTEVAEFASGIGNDLLDLIFPALCIVCDQELPTAQMVLCPLCRASVVRIGRRGCRKCGAEPLPGSSPRPARCRRCARRNFAFQRAVMATCYSGSIRELVLAVKFRRRREGLHFLARELARALRETSVANRVGLVTAVPLHPLRRLVRGFDQADLLARLIARQLGLPHRGGMLRRTRKTSAQAEADPASRAGRMEGAFRARWFRRRRIRGRSVLLVDDVMSTGATADAAARALLLAGAKKVYVASGAS